MPDRFASISTLLPARPTPQPASDQPSEQQPDAQPEESSATPSPRLGPVRSRPPHRTTELPSPRASDTADGGIRRVAFRLDPTLHRQLNERATTSGTSKGNVVLDAIEDAHTATALNRADPQPARTGMFARTQDRGPATPSVLVEIKLTSQALQTLDQLVERTKQTTRTQLIHAALNHYFRQAPTNGDGQSQS